MADPLSEVVVESVRVHMLSSQHVVLLKQTERERYLPIWIGPWEANAIATRLQGVAPERPMTHDLLKNIIIDMRASVSKIVVNQLKDNTFYALIFLEQNGEIIRIDARPSDAIALALRTESPIYVEEEVIAGAKSSETMKDAVDTERLQKWLENLDPDELGKYKM